MTELAGRLYRSPNSGGHYGSGEPSSARRPKLALLIDLQ